MKRISTFMIISVLLLSCKKQEESVPKQMDTNHTNKVVLSSEVVWEKLNPTRGDQSPQAGTLWGDRKGSPATGFLAKFVDGFSSPPHIHNITYRAVVIQGLIHNDDEQAEKMWMKPGSFWTLPQDEVHITASKGESIALVEIDHGPYLVKPTEEAFDNGTRPVNIDVSNIVWLDKNQSNWIHQTANAKLSFLWEHKGSKGLFVKLPAGFNGEITTDGSILHSVVIQGNINYQMPTDNATKALDVGSYFGSTDPTIHKITNSSEGETIIYIRTNSTIKIDE